MKDKIDLFLEKYNGNLIKSQELEFDNMFGGKSLVCFYYKENALFANSFHDDPKNSGKVLIGMNMLELDEYLIKYLKK